MEVRSMGFDEFKLKVKGIAGIDLGLYQSNIVKRRLENIMKRKGIKSLSEYWLYIRNDKAELQKLLDFIVINVTEFFRDIERFDYLQNTILPKLFKMTLKPNIWSAACSSGEEVYSLAIILHEATGRRIMNLFGTDIDSDVLTQAKRGEYDSKSLKNVSKKRKELYFLKTEGRYAIKKNIRSKIKFDYFDFLSDIFPGATYHLICCRNALIHFEHKIKNDIYKKFHYSLVKGGYLFLGSSEKILTHEKIGFKAHMYGFYEKL